MQVPVELKIRYLERRNEDLRQLLTALASNDFEPALKLGHQVKGNAVTFEFPQMETLGFQIEQAAKMRDAETLKMLVEKMNDEIKQAQRLFH